MQLRQRCCPSKPEFNGKRSQSTPRRVGIKSRWEPQEYILIILALKLLQDAALPHPKTGIRNPLHHRAHGWARPGQLSNSLAFSGQGAPTATCPVLESVYQC